MVWASSLQHRHETGSWPSHPGVLLKSIKPKGLNDPWGNPYRITFDPSRQTVEIMSAGIDGVWGSPDDLTECRREDP